MNRITRNLVVLVVSAMALSGLALAQNSNHRVAANIPFDFYAGSQQLPAGWYTLTVDSDERSVSLRNESSGRSYVLPASPANGSGLSQTVLEFDVVGSTYLLADLKASSDGLKFPEGKVALETAQRKAPVAIVAAVR